MGKHLKISIILALVCSVLLSQNDINSTQHAFKYKLDYNVPESPAFSILDENPVRVNRASAAQELIVNFANSFISNDNLSKGIAIDFNPYFVLGGRLKSINSYREKKINRILANTQLSVATTTIKDFPDDIFVSTGVRITLFDSKDILQHKELGKRIDAALKPAEDQNPFNKDIDIIVKNTALLEAYALTKEELRNKKGAALSIGFATAGRFINSHFNLDSLNGFRNQAWISGQYSFGKGIDLMSLVMFRSNNIINQKDINELKLGVGLKYLTQNVNIGGELVYSSEKSNLDIGVNIEILIMKRLILYASIGNRSSIHSIDEDKIKIMPGIKWNLSETKT